MLVLKHEIQPKGSEIKFNPHFTIMSQFNGVFTSLPGVSCDRFTGVNLNADQFFLSHCHADHMIGLDQFLPTLKRRNAVKVNHRIYCSSISKTFLVKKFKDINERWITALSHNEPVVLNIFDRGKNDMYKLKVTSIPAQHCPGSVMFLFAIGEDVTKRNILYTGDFRFENQRLDSIHALHDTEGKTLPIHEMYLDTTFCSSNYTEFPTRDQAIQRMWGLVHSWIRKNGMYRRKRAKHVVLFHLPAQYGSEAILRHIYEQSSKKWKIHVSQGKYDEYLCTDDLEACTSCDPAEAQWIHACSWKAFSNHANNKTAKYFSRSIPCQDGPFEFCHIRPSAMYFRTSCMDKYEDKVVKCIGGESYRVCYSAHSSLSELRKFVDYLKPNIVFPCVLPKGMTHQDVLSLLRLENIGNDDLSESKLTQTHPCKNEPNLNSTINPGLSDVGSYIPEKHDYLDYAENLTKQDTQDFFYNSSPEKEKNLVTSNTTRKRKLSLSIKSNPGNNAEDCIADKMWDPKNKMQMADYDSNIKFSTSENDSTDDEGGNEICASKKRKCFQKSSKQIGALSMPAKLASCKDDGEWLSKNACLYNNRASLPDDWMIPEIKITPSSPGLDPNDPNYPEFFEGKLYRESKMSSSSDNNNKYDDLKNATSPENTYYSNRNGGSSSPLTAPTNEQERNASIGTLSDGGNHSDYDELQSTPEFDFVMERAKSETERQNCINFARKNLKRKLSEN